MSANQLEASKDSAGERLPAQVCRVEVVALRPCVDDGAWPVKRELGDELTVEADILVDGHDVLAGVLRYRLEGAAEPGWSEVALEALGNDVYGARVRLEHLGRLRFTVEAWVDSFAGARRGLAAKWKAGQDVEVELRGLARLITTMASHATGAEAAQLAAAALLIESGSAAMAERVDAALDDTLAACIERHPDRRLARRGPERVCVVEPVRARFSTWYEFFPRSTGADGRHGTLRDAEAMLAHAAQLGFDVVYLPPIHPIGMTYRKGRDNGLTAQPGEPGSPWAIGAPEGGHTAIHPELGTLDDFRHFVASARALGVDVALDIAFQASPDHPWIAQHPGWFMRRADGTLQYAENPPKKYQDVYPFDFECADWRGLWRALRDVFLFWAGEGVRVFRVDNPHTKPLPFWAWCLAETKQRYPDAIFLAEAFTRPKMMHALAKLGFSQSYTYFTWRNSADELRRYFEELSTPPVADFLRPNLWPTTPDILPEPLQFGGRPAFASRLILAATLGASYGLYGPAYETLAHEARPGSEEYADSEKYTLKSWDLERPDSLRHLIKRLNEIRRSQPALQRNDGLHFHRSEDPALLCYSKTTAGADAILVVVNLDPRHRHAGRVTLDLDALELSGAECLQVHELVGDSRQLWQGASNHVEIDPAAMPGMIYRVRRLGRSEHDFEYYL
ncbi:MAG: DUF3416 domain-containing protein [Deltaproteobacteria bacterium]|nr:DUF3416 domain-containing protein [Deltaproteobacteria bacterium]